MLHQRFIRWAATILICTAVGHEAVAGTSLFVSSGDTDSVLVYDASTGDLWGTFTRGGPLEEPEGVTFGPDGEFYVASAATGQVLRYDGRTGEFLGVFASGSGLVDPAGIAFGGPDNDLFVSAGIPDEGPGGNQILRFDGETGAFEAVVDPENVGGLNDPEGLAFGPNGLLYVNSAEDGEVLRYDPATNAFVDEFIAATASGGLADPLDLAFGPGGDLFVSSAETSEVKRFEAATGAFLGNFVTAGAGGLDEAEGLAFGPNGNLFVVSELGNAVLEFDRETGEFVGALVTPGLGGLGEPTFITFGPTPIPLPPAAWTGLLALGGLVSSRAWQTWRKRTVRG